MCVPLKKNYGFDFCCAARVNRFRVFFSILILPMLVKKFSLECDRMQFSKTKKNLIFRVNKKKKKQIDSSFLTRQSSRPFRSRAFAVGGKAQKEDIQSDSSILISYSGFRAHLIRIRTTSQIFSHV